MSPADDAPELVRPSTEPPVVLDDVELSPAHMPAATAALRTLVRTPEPTRMAPSLSLGSAPAAYGPSEQGHRATAPLSAAGRTRQRRQRVSAAELVGRRPVGAALGRATAWEASVRRPEPPGQGLRAQRPGRYDEPDREVVAPAAAPPPLPSSIDGEPSQPAPTALPEEAGAAEAAPQVSAAPALPRFDTPLLPPLAASVEKRRAVGQAAVEAGLRRAVRLAADEEPGARQASGRLDVRGLLAQVRAALAGDGPAPEKAWRALDAAVRSVGGTLLQPRTDDGPTLMRLPPSGTEASPERLGVLEEIEQLTAGLARIEARGAPAAVPQWRPQVAGDVVAPTSEAAPEGRGPEAPVGTPSETSPSYFGPPAMARDVARRLLRSGSGRRLAETLRRGGPSQAPTLPRTARWASAAADGAPRGAVPAEGKGLPADVVAGIDFQLIAATDQWQLAFPGREPYVADEPGEGKEEPDFRDAAPTAPPAPTREELAAVNRDPKVTALLKELGLLGADGGAVPGSAPAMQGAEQSWSMALVRPVMQVVQEMAQPLLKEPQEGTPMAGISPSEKGVEEADSEKIEFVAYQIFKRLRMMIETEQDRRGF